MQIDLMLANGVDEEDALLNVFGVGWEGYTVPQLPGTLNLGIAAVLSFTPDDPADPFLKITLRLIDPEGDVVSSAVYGLLYTHPAGAHSVHVFPRYLEDIAIKRAGIYRVELVVGDRVERRCHFDVQQGNFPEENTTEQP